MNNRLKILSAAAIAIFTSCGGNKGAESMEKGESAMAVVEAAMMEGRNAARDIGNHFINYTAQLLVIRGLWQNLNGNTCAHDSSSFKKSNIVSLAKAASSFQQAALLWSKTPTT